MRPPVMAVVACVLPVSAFAGSFQLFEGSTDWEANVYAGQASKAYDAGTAWANPAGMVRLPAMEIDSSLNFVEPQFSFSGRNTIFPDPAAGHDAATGVGAIYGALVPGTFNVVPLGDGLAVGLAVKSPFGARIDYAKNWIGRYQSLVSSLTDIAVEPSVAWAVTRAFSVGGGLVIDYMHVRETQAVRPALGGQYGDIIGDVGGTDYGLGYNLGALYQLDDGTRFGISYRSRIEHRVSIQQTLTPTASLAESPLGPLVAAVLRTQNTPGKPYAEGYENFALPDQLDLSAYHEIGPLAIMADVIWTHWQVFQNIAVVTFGNGNKPILNQFGFHNTIFGSLGASYRLPAMPNLLLQTGIAYDGDPVNDANRQAQIPTQDRVILGLGFTYDMTRRIAIDAAYNHFFCASSTIDNTGPSLANSLQLPQGRLIGSYDNAIDSFSVGIKIRL